ncbi:ABC transporter ATP-binding protein [Blautia ammoniilytica]|uniref:ABC transporter ATP-binding protein/permease n=1 Tax=Blautia ammoniilytica TaxID=2981782 RepID=A0ABT2TXS5_9FIRM|nr:ABC transporter ATP-binding protein [Blautia ammoniilytica]MCU6767010.1 ABC transporter ATP-binding protein/permease [Blautia ammoniilytica]SCI96912.1 Lipid A export ATP-binding/permease protein MsbA [uncultured Blautia sp.]
MFGTVKRIIDWCGSFKKNLYIGFIFSFFSGWFAAMPVIWAAYIIGKLVECEGQGKAVSTVWIGKSIVILLFFIFLRFLFDYLRARFQESISYELIARDRLAVGDALKRVSLGYFQNMNTGTILNSITTGLHTLEGMGIRMIDNFVGGYLNFICILLWLTCMNWRVGLIAVTGAAVSLIFLLIISKYSTRNAPVLAAANRDLTGATLEYARGLSVVKSFGKAGASMDSMKKACRDSRDINLKIEWGYIPYNALHLLALKTASVCIVIAAFYLGFSGQLDFTYMMIIILLSFHVFGSLEPIADCAHVLAVIDDALDHLDELTKESFIDADGQQIEIAHYDIEFRNVDFSYGEGRERRQVLHNVNLKIPEYSVAAIVGPSGSGKSTICNLIARFYDADSGSVRVGGHDVKEFTCDSLLSNISMVFQNVYLFHDTVRNNICFGKTDATEAEMVEAAKKARCHDFIMALPEGYDTVIGEGGGSLSGGEKQRISIARAILKDAPIIILDEATASVDPENEHLIQAAISELTKGKTIVTIAHRLATIEQADQILVVDNGQIIQRGTHTELVAVPGKYKDFVDIRSQSEGWKIG